MYGWWGGRSRKAIWATEIHAVGALWETRRGIRGPRDLSCVEQKGGVFETQDSSTKIHEVVNSFSFRDFKATSSIGLGIITSLLIEPITSEFSHHHLSSHMRESSPNAIRSQCDHHNFIISVFNPPPGLYS